MTIGSRWLLYIGVIAVIIGIAYFEKLAMEYHWIGETARVVQGAAAGIAMIYLGWRFARTGYEFYGQVVSGCGVAILYVSTYAAFNLYHLVSRPIAFALMCGVTALAAWLADRQRAQSLAVVAAAGGFVTPLLVSSPEDAHVALFVYELILIAGTMVLARRRSWPALNIVSYLLTVLTITAWASGEYDASMYLSTELFLTAAFGMYAFILHERPNRILWTAPVLYYIASIGVLGDHSAPLLVYLVLLMLLGVVMARRTRPALRLACWIAAALPLLDWTSTHASAAWLTAGMVAWAGVYLLALAGVLEAALARAGEGLRGSDVALLHASGLTTYVGMYWLLEPVRLPAAGPTAAAFAVWHGALAAFGWTRRRDVALHAAALALTFLVIFVGAQFDGAWLTSGWAVEGAAIIWLGLRERRTWMRAGGVIVFAMAIRQLLMLQSADPAVGEVALFNARAACGLLVAALAYGLVRIHARLSEPARRDLETGIGLVLGTLVLLSAAIAEVVAYWKLHAPPPFEPASQIVMAVLIAGGALMWLGLSRRQEWIRGIGGLLLLGVATALWILQADPVPAGYVPILNGRAIAGVAAVLSLYGLAWLHRRDGGHLADVSTNVAILVTAAALVTIGVLTSEINAYWQVREAATLARAGDAERARQMMLSVTWAIYATILIIVGLKRRYAPARYLAMLIFAFTILKVFTVDLAGLDRIYRVVSLLGLGAMLLVSSYLYQRMRRAPDGQG
ncbi:MAG TPA: DUF2339 domain-containing protein [Vicinamibacterales bacterium]|nr:DUF2339 domain-containing protein [Vicinamibacterales bacterium]